jgi:hypothetical protein
LNKLNRAPIFEKLKEDNVRQGFLGWNDFDKILAEVREQWRQNTIEFSPWSAGGLVGFAIFSGSTSF